MAKQRIALVLRGGVSLGAYIAGALDELAYALGQTNDYEVDILTGASAGATTAALVASGMLYRKGAIDLHDVWVKCLDIVDLLAPLQPAGAPFTLLSDYPLRRIAQRVTAGLTRLPEARRASWSARQVTLAMTLGNTTALPYVSSTELTAAGGGQSYVQYRQAEQESYDLEANSPPDMALWQRIVRVAQASAAFPFAFPAVALTRQASNKQHYLQRPRFNDADQGEAQFWYYDGGVFNNLPLDLAGYYAHQRSRKGSKKSSGEDSSAAKDSTSGLPDWLRDRIFVMIAPSPNTIEPPASQVSPPGLLRYIDGLLKGLYLESGALQFAQEYQPQQDTRALRALPGMNQMPELALKHVVLIMPDTSAPRLYGSYLAAFSGFLDERFREYDFRRGAADAARAARQVLLIDYQPPPRPDGFYQPDQDPKLRCDLSSYHSLGNLSSSRYPALTIKQVFEGALKRRLRILARQLPMPALSPGYALLAQCGLLGCLPSLWNR